MMIINHSDDRVFLKKIFERVFVSNNAFNKMFVSSIEKKIIVCPTAGYYLSEDQYLALNNTIKQYGEEFYYLSEVEGEAFKEKGIDNIHCYQHLELNIDTTYAEYFNKNIIFENAFYSSSAKWGVIVSHEDFAVIGGTQKFIATFKSLYPNWKSDQEEFLKIINYWGKQSNNNLSWIHDFIKYINE
ncbi:hypothetical protein ACFLYH_03500 [Candidatus Dependentiae bacterium]